MTWGAKVRIQESLLKDVIFQALPVQNLKSEIGFPQAPRMLSSFP